MLCISVKGTVSVRIPTAAQISPSLSLDLDEKLAVQEFFGVDISEAEDLFRENSYYYCGLLGSMGPTAFSYYLDAYIPVFRTCFDQGEWSCLLIILSGADGRSRVVSKSKARLQPMIQFAIENLPRFIEKPREQLWYTNYYREWMDRNLRGASGILEPQATKVIREKAPDSP